jgi:hypothetical protein
MNLKAKRAEYERLREDTQERRQALLSDLHQLETAIVALGGAIQAVDDLIAEEAKEAATAQEVAI